MPGIGPGTGELQGIIFGSCPKGVHSTKDENKAQALSTRANTQWLSIISNTQFQIKLIVLLYLT